MLLAVDLDLAHDHSTRQKLYNRFLRKYRKLLWIPPRWTITFEIRCPEQMPAAQGFCTWRYLPNAQFKIVLSCALSDDLAEWVIAHELLEALTANYAQFCEQSFEYLEKEQIPEQVLLLLREQHGDVRNEMIEWLLRILLKRERPESWDDPDDMQLA